MKEDIRIHVAPRSYGKDMSGPFVDGREKNESSRSKEVMFAEHLPVFGDSLPPDFVLSWGVLPTFLDPRAGIESLGGSFPGVFLPSVV